MAKLYYDRYMRRVRRGEITVTEAIELARVEVPSKWREMLLHCWRRNYDNQRQVQACPQ